MSAVAVVVPVKYDINYGVLHRTNHLMGTPEPSITGYKNIKCLYVQ